MTFTTELKLLLVWLVAAEIVALALTVVLLVRQSDPPSWRSAGKTFLISSAIASCLPVLLLVLRVLQAVAGALASVTLVLAAWWWVVPVALAVAGLGVVIMWHVRSREQDASPVGSTAQLPSPRPSNLEVAAAPVQPTIWSLPDEYRVGGL